MIQDKKDKVQFFFLNFVRLYPYLVADKEQFHLFLLSLASAGQLDTLYFLLLFVLKKKKEKRKKKKEKRKKKKRKKEKSKA